MNRLPEWDVGELMQRGDPQAADAGMLWAGLDRGALRRQLAAGELQELPFEAVVFRAAYPNWNYVRFRAEELGDFARSFAGVPFLRNHDLHDISARDGIVTACWMEGPEMHARITLTTPEGIRDFLAGRIDRFSISWFKRGQTLCSICGEDWLSPACPHAPGRRYPAPAGGRATGSAPGSTPGNAPGAPEERLCELVQVGPVGREISAVNAPASAGTQVLAQALARAWAFKQQLSPPSSPHALVRPPADYHAPPSSPHALVRPPASYQPPALSRTNKEQIMNEPTYLTTTPADAAGELDAELAAALVDMGPTQALAAGPTQWQAQWHTLRQAALGELEQLQRERSRLRLETQLEASGLPPAAQIVVREAAGDGRDAAAVGQLIKAQRAALASAAQPAVVNGLRPLTAADLRTGADVLQEAMDWCLGVQGGPLPAPSLRNIRDVYLAVTGDGEFYGVFNPDQTQLAAATTATLPGLAKNSLNKVIRQHYDNLATFRWYERVVDVVAHDGSTQDIDLVMVDGLASLPTVNEGAVYTEASAGDSSERMSFGKRGVYVGITLEMFRRSDIAKMQAIPRELVKAAIRTRSAAIAGVFTAASGVGPTLADDSKALFHADHGNLGTAALGAAEWAAARKRLFSQTVPGTSNKLGLWPVFCLVPIDLYDAALELFGYGTGDVGKPNTAGTAQTVNPYGDSRPGDPRPIPVVVPEWTDADNWAQIVDPRLHPVIQMAYASAPQGGVHALPEIYEVRSETTGLMFTNDTLPIKIRDWWAYGVATHVGVGKNNVTA